ANASAIQTTQTKVDNIDGRLTTATDSITSLNSRMSTAEGNINSTNTAVGGLSTRMATAEGKITNQSDSIASLQNSVTSINGTLANKADSSAVNNLTSRVETAEGKISSQSGQITSLSNSLDLTNSNLNDVNVLARLLSLGKPLRDDPTFKLGMGGLAPYALQSGSTLTRQAVSADNPTESTYEVLLRATTTLGSGWYPNNPTVLGGPNKAFLVKQVIKMPTGQRVYPYNNPLGTGGFVRMLGNAEGTGKFETYYSIIQCGPDASKSIQGHFRVINSTNPPVPTTSNPVDVILASYEVFDVTAVNDTIPKAYSDAISANANAINSLSNSVTQQGNTITSQGNSITQLNNSITTINGTLSTKADSSALTNLANRVTTAENSITSQGSSITSLNSSVTGILKDIEVTDTRSTNQPPSWYWSNYPKRIVREFKQASTIGLSGMGTYVSLETYVYYSDATGGPIIQIARGTDSKLTAERRSTSTSTWGTWVQDIKAISDGLANKAEASALSSLDSKVSVIDGKVSTQASSITTLQTTVGGNTASIQSQQQSIDGLKARATLKLQSGNLVGGVGIENDSKTVDFIIQANKFAIGAPSDVTSAVTPKYAFTYQSTPTTLPNGTVIPAGLYLDSASISYINANKIYADSLSAISANLGTFTSLADQSKPNGARTVISGERIEVYDENNVMRVRIGRW
ncbi:TPA: phage tail protein, partial [Acinetobacter baumannii]